MKFDFCRKFVNLIYFDQDMSLSSFGCGISLTGKPISLFQRSDEDIVCALKCQHDVLVRSS
jgi:hypothetical protein